MNYDQQNKFIEIPTKREEFIIENYIFQLQELFNSNVFDKMLDKKFGFHMPGEDPHFSISDKSQLFKFKGSLHFLEAANNSILNWQKNQKRRAEALVKFIYSEYHLSG